MNFNSFGTAVKLKSVQTYNSVNTNAKNVFKNQFYSDIKDINYSQYEDIDYNSINLEEGIENVKDYKQWYEELWSVGASAINTVVGFCEGILEFGEDIFDAACWVNTITNTGPFLFTDLATGIFTGDWDFSNTSAYWNKSASFISKDLVGETFDSLYDKGPLKYVEEASYGAFKREGGVVYGISKSSGYYATACAVSSVIPGLNPATVKGLTFGFSKLGDSLESSFNEATTDEFGNKKQASLKELGKASAISLAKGTVEGGIMAAATGITENGKTLSEIQKNLGLSDDVIKSTLKAYNTRAIKVKAIKPLANEIVGLVNGEEFNVNEVFVDTAAVIISENVASTLKPITPKVSFKTHSSAPDTAQTMEGLEEIVDLGTTPEASQIVSKFGDTIKGAISEGLNKGVEKAQKETVKEGIDGVVSMFD